VVEPFGVPELRDLLLGIVDRMPDNRNPVGLYGSCVFDDGDGRHCIIGQLAYEQGWRSPGSNPFANEWDASKAASYYGWPVTPVGGEMLDRVQAAADTGPMLWGLLRDVILSLAKEFSAQEAPAA